MSKVGGLGFLHYLSVPTHSRRFRGNRRRSEPNEEAVGAFVTHGGQRRGAGPVLRLDLGRLVGVRGLSRRELGRLNDRFHVFVHICRAGEVGSAGGGVESDQANEAE